MDSKLRKTILRYLYDKKKTTTVHDVCSHCLLEYKVPEKDFVKRDDVETKVRHIINVLLGEGLIANDEGDYSHFIWLTADGYKEFSPLYKKFWNFINDDFAKLLSLISLLLSIIATWISLHK